MASSKNDESWMEEYWAGTGGAKWIENLIQIEKVLEPIGEKLLHKISPKIGLNVLDVGCGGAQMAAKLAGLLKPNGKVTASDISEPIINAAKKHYNSIPNLEFLCCDVQSYAFDERAFDAVVSRFGVMFFTDPATAFHNIHRSLKSDGTLTFLAWKTLDENLWMKVPAFAAYEVLERPEPAAEDEPGPFSMANQEVVRQLLEETGFKKISLEEKKVDLNLGSLDDAVHLMTELGPASRSFIEASEASQIKAKILMGNALAQFETPEGIVLPSASWLVEASV